MQQRRRPMPAGTFASRCSTDVWRQETRLPLLVHRHKCELSLGHLGSLAFALTQNPNLHVERKGGSPKLFQPRIATYRVAHLNWLQEDDA